MEANEPCLEIPVGIVWWLLQSISWRLGIVCTMLSRSPQPEDSGCSHVTSFCSRMKCFCVSMSEDFLYHISFTSICSSLPFLWLWYRNNTACARYRSGPILGNCRWDKRALINSTIRGPDNRHSRLKACTRTLKHGSLKLQLQRVRHQLTWYSDNLWANKLGLPPDTEFSLGDWVMERVRVESTSMALLISVHAACALDDSRKLVTTRAHAWMPCDEIYLLPCKSFRSYRVTLFVVTSLDLGHCYCTEVVLRR